MNKNIVFYAITIILSGFLLSCKKKTTVDPEAPAATTGSMVVKFEHLYEGSPFTLNADTYYKTSGDDSLKFSKFQFYVSNIQLTKTDGSIWIQPESYYFINYAEAQQGVCRITLNDIPAAEYTDIQFIIGVDSTRNVSGAQSGALDPMNGAFWSWNTGYIFLKAEGTYKNGSTGNFMYHIGGFKNANNSNALQTLSYNFGPLPVAVNQNAAPQVHYKVDVSKMFEGPGTTISVSTTPTHMMTGSTSVNISKNYREMFAFDHVHR